MTIIGVAMILRMYAMYGRPKIILGILLVMYITEVVIFLIGGSIYIDPSFAASAYRVNSNDTCRSF